jgi:hypothetical protein
MSDRYTADTINDDALDQLYDRLDRARDAAALHRQGLLTTAELYAVIEAAPEPGPAATQATRPGHVITIEGDPAAAHWASSRAAMSEAIRQMDVDTTNTHTGLVVQPYRDHGEQKWVFRCWGTDTCDGWLSLDHYSEQSAERARDRHVTEEHPNEEQH